MPRYYFDIQDGGSRHDVQGTECATLEDVRKEAMRVLPDIAREQVPGNGDRRTFTVVARAERGHAVYTAMLSFAGALLART